MALTNDDIRKIKKALKPEFDAVEQKVKKALKPDFNRLEKGQKRIEKKLDTSIDFMDKEFLKLKSRVDRYHPTN